MANDTSKALTMTLENIEGANERVRKGNFLPPLRDENTSEFDAISDDDDVEHEASSPESVYEDAMGPAERRHHIDLYEEDETTIAQSFDETCEDDDQWHDDYRARRQKIRPLLQQSPSEDTVMRDPSAHIQGVSNDSRDGTPSFLPEKQLEILQGTRWVEADLKLEEAEAFDHNGNYGAAYDRFQEAADILEKFWKAELNHEWRKAGRRRLLNTRERVAGLEKAIIPGRIDVGDRLGKPMVDHGKIVKMRLEDGLLISDDSPTELEVYKPRPPVPVFSPAMLHWERWSSRTSPRSAPLVRTVSPLTSTSRSSSPGPGSPNPIGTVEASDTASTSAQQSPSPDQSRSGASTPSRPMTPIEHLRELTPDHPSRGESAYVPDTNHDPRTLRSRGVQDPHHKQRHCYEKGQAWHDREHSAPKDLIKRTVAKDLDDKGDPSGTQDLFWDHTGTAHGAAAKGKYDEIADQKIKHFREGVPIAPLYPRLGTQRFDGGNAAMEKCGESSSDKGNEDDVEGIASDHGSVHTVYEQEPTNTPHCGPIVSVVEVAEFQDEGKDEADRGHRKPAQQPASTPQYETLLSAIEGSGTVNTAAKPSSSALLKDKHKCSVCPQYEDVMTKTPCYPCERCGRVWFCRTMCQNMTKNMYPWPCSPTSEGHHALIPSEGNSERGEHGAAIKDYMATLGNMLAQREKTSPQTGHGRSATPGQTVAPFNATRPKPLSQKAKGKRKVTQASGAINSPDSTTQEEEEPEMQEALRLSLQDTQQSLRKPRAGPAKASPQGQAPKIDKGDARDKDEHKGGPQSQAALQSLARLSNTPLQTSKVDQTHMRQSLQIAVHCARTTKDRRRTLEYLMTPGPQARPRWLEGTDARISSPEWTYAIVHYWRTDPSLGLLVFPEQHARRVEAEPY